MVITDNNDVINSFDNLCKYLLMYRNNYINVTAGHLAGFKRKQDYKCLTNFLKKDLHVDTVVKYLYELFTKVGADNIKTRGYIILNDIINDIFTMGVEFLTDDQIKELETILSETKVKQDQLIIENLDLIFENEIPQRIDVNSLSLSKNDNYIINSISTNQLNNINIVDDTQNIINDTQSNNNVVNNITIDSNEINPNINNTTSLNVNINNDNSHTITTNLLKDFKEIMVESLQVNNVCSKIEIAACVNDKFNEFSSLFVTMDTANQHINTIEDILIKQMRVNNDFKILKSHLELGTVPYALNFNQFPSPLFPDDRTYIDNYNEFIYQKQKEWLEFNLKELERKNNNFTEDLINLKSIVKLKYTNVDNIIQNLKDKITEMLKNEFINADKKMRNTINKKFEVRNTMKNTNEIKKRNNKKNTKAINDTTINIESEEKISNINETNNEKNNKTLQTHNNNIVKNNNYESNQLNNNNQFQNNNHGYYFNQNYNYQRGSHNNSFQNKTFHKWNNNNNNNNNSYYKNSNTKQFKNQDQVFQWRNPQNKLT